MRRYLEGFGPASAADIGVFTMLRKPPVQQALADLGDELVRLEGPDGVELYDVPGGPIPTGRSKAPPRLLGMWDNVLLAYADRGRVLPESYRPHVIRRNGDVLPAVLVDGRVAGVWRAIDGAIEVTAFHDLSTATWRALTTEARELATFLAARDPDVYRRYHHWWTELPAFEVRRLSSTRPRACRQESSRPAAPG